MAYLTKEIVKSDWLNKTAGETDADALIDRLIANVEAEIKNICAQPIEAESVTRYFDGDGTSVKMLPYTVPVTYTSLAYREEPDDGWTAISSGVAVYERQGLQYVWNDDTFGENFYKLIVSAGYATAAVPKDIVICGYEMVKELFLSTPFASQGDRFGVSAITEGQAGVSFSKSLLSMRPRAEQRLQHYRWLAL